MEADDEAAADGDAAKRMEDGDQNDDRPACSMCFVPLDLSKLVTAKDEEVLTCDGSCGRDMPWQELRFYCVTDCDFDMCTACVGFKRRDSSSSQHHHLLAHHWGTSPVPAPLQPPAPPEFLSNRWRAMLGCRQTRAFVGKSWMQLSMARHRLLRNSVKNMSGLPFCVYFNPSR